MLFQMLRFFLFNVWMDGICILLAGKFFRLRIVPVRVLQASLFGGISSILVLFSPKGLEKMIVPGVLVFMSLCVFGKNFLRGSAAISFSAVMLSGLGYFLENFFSSPEAAKWGCILTGLSLLFPRASVAEEKVSLTFFWKKKKLQLPAIWDTGNLLQDPLTGLPVIVAPASLMEDVFPKDQTTFEGMRLISVQTAGGKALLPCFHPGFMEISSKNRKTQRADMMVAISFQPLPGALIPVNMMKGKL